MSLMSVPMRTILMYCADVANETLPVDYAYCDGTTLNSTQQDIVPGGNFTLPDLRNQVLLGADRTLALGTAGSITDDTATGAPGARTISGQSKITLSTAQLADHTHPATTGAAGSHSHTGSTQAQGNHTHFTGLSNWFIITSGAGNNLGTNLGVPQIYITSVDSITTTQPDHSHTGGGINSGGNHGHGMTMASTGSNTAWDMRPTMMGMVYIMKVKK